MESSPNVVEILANIAGIIPHIYTTLGYVVILYSIWMTIDGLLDMGHAARKKHRFSGSNNGTALGGFFKLIIAGLLLTLAVDGSVISIGSSLFFPDNSHSFISIDTYVSDGSENELKKMMRIVVIGFTQIVGVFTIFKGLRTWSKAADKEIKNGFAQGAGYLVAGILCVQVARVIGVVQATVGFNFLNMVGF